MEVHSGITKTSAIHVQKKRCHHYIFPVSASGIESETQTNSFPETTQQNEKNSSLYP
jgi:hypothetical protein